MSNKSPSSSSNTNTSNTPQRIFVDADNKPMMFYLIPSQDPKIRDRQVLTPMIERHGGATAKVFSNGLITLLPKSVLTKILFEFFF